MLTARAHEPHASRPASKQENSGHSSFGWQIEAVEAPFEFLQIRDPRVAQVSEVASIKQIAECYLEIGGQITAPPLSIDGIGTLLCCENAQGERFAYLEEDEPVRTEGYF